MGKWQKLYELVIVVQNTHLLPEMQIIPCSTRESKQICILNCTVSQKAILKRMGGRCSRD